MNRKGLVLIGLIMLFGVGIFSCVVFWSQNDTNSLTTHTLSTKLPSTEKKIEFLRKYVRLESNVIETEFKIDYWDNSKGLVPGPSDWDMTLAMKVPADQVEKWTKGFVEVDSKNIDMKWWNVLPLNKRIWQRSSKPKFYQRPNRNVFIVSYFQEGIILKKIASSNLTKP